jgi:hypothetical protein
VSETLPSAFDAWFAARHPEIPVSSARAVLELAQGGAPASFIARYRRDRTGGLDARAVRRVLEAAELAAKVRSRQSIILESIERHATLAPELRERILETFDPDALEDLYHPYRQQKKNRALAAREAGLQPLADWIWGCGHGSEQPQEGQTLELWAFTFRNEEKGVPDAKAAIEGARDILVERLAGTPQLRALVRREYFEKGCLASTRAAKAKPHSRFEPYFAFRERVAALREPEHALTYLALRRGLAEDELQLSLGGAADDAEFEARLLAAFEAAACSVSDSPGAEVLRHAGRIALKNDVRTGIENEVHRVLKEAADAVVASGFAESARKRLLAAPFGARPVLGIDPDLRNGCRVAALDGAGALVASRVVELANDEQKAAAGETLAAFAREHQAAAVAVGDGSGCREVELLTRAALRSASHDAPVVLVSESGARGWAASEAARAELPDAEPPVRAAVSIGRRLQDPLAELVKLDPKSLGSGQHHHDVPARAAAARGRRRGRGRVGGRGRRPEHGAARAPRAGAGAVARRSRRRSSSTARRTGASRPVARSPSCRRLAPAPSITPRASCASRTASTRSTTPRSIPSATPRSRRWRRARQDRGRPPGRGRRARARGPGAGAGARAAGEGRPLAGPRRGREGPAPRVRAVRVPRRRAVARPAQAGHGVSRAGDERDELRRLRRRRRAARRPRPRLAARPRARRRVGPGASARRPRRGARAEGWTSRRSRCRSRCGRRPSASRDRRASPPGGPAARRRRRRMRLPSRRARRRRGRSAPRERPRPERPRPRLTAHGLRRIVRDGATRRPRPPAGPRARRPAAERRPEPRRQAFNNPFAVLADLKKTGKG